MNLNNKMMATFLFFKNVHHHLIEEVFIGIEKNLRGYNRFFQFSRNFKERRTTRPLSVVELQHKC